MSEPSDSESTNARHARKSRSFRFGTRLLFLITTVVAITLGVTMKQLHDRKAAIKTIRDAGGTIGYSIGGPGWLRGLIQDEECFYEPKRVSLGLIAKDNPVLNDDILASVSQPLKDFLLLEALDIRRSTVTDKSAPLLAQLRPITALRLSGTRITDETIKHIKQLPNLQTLWLANTQLTDDCVTDLCEMDTLTSLNISGTKISPDAIKQIRETLPKCTVSK